MKYTEVKLVPLSEDDREQFILDNQWAFKHGALYEFGELVRHILIKETFISMLTNVVF